MEQDYYNVQKAYDRLIESFDKELKEEPTIPLEMVKDEEFVKDFESALDKAIQNNINKRLSLIINGATKELVFLNDGATIEMCLVYLIELDPKWDAFLNTMPSLDSLIENKYPKSDSKTIKVHTGIVGYRGPIILLNLNYHNDLFQWAFTETEGVYQEVDSFLDRIINDNPLEESALKSKRDELAFETVWDSFGPTILKLPVMQVFRDTYLRDLEARDGFNLTEVDDTVFKPKGFYRLTKEYPFAKEVLGPLLDAFPNFRGQDFLKVKLDTHMTLTESRLDNLSLSFEFDLEQNTIKVHAQPIFKLT